MSGGWNHKTSVYIYWCVYMYIYVLYRCAIIELHRFSPWYLRRVIAEKTQFFRGFRCWGLEPSPHPGYAAQGSKVHINMDCSTMYSKKSPKPWKDTGQKFVPSKSLKAKQENCTPKHWRVVQLIITFDWYPSYISLSPLIFSIFLLVDLKSTYRKPRYLRCFFGGSCTFPFNLGGLNYGMDWGQPTMHL